MNNPTRTLTLEALSWELEERDDLISPDAFDRAGHVESYRATEITLQGFFELSGIEQTTISQQSRFSCDFCNMEYHVSGGLGDLEQKDIQAAVEEKLPIHSQTGLVVPIEGTHRTTDCSNCFGKGEVVCDFCEGPGEIPCEECNGNGQQQTRKQCQICDNNNSRDCEQCEGDGYIYLIEECYECQGAGTEECSTCNGTGEVVCDSCEGIGEHHEYDGYMWDLHVDWTITGIPEQWNHAVDDWFNKIAMKLNWTSVPYDLNWHSPTTVNPIVSVDTQEINTGFLKVEYDNEISRGLLIYNDGEHQFIFDPSTGGIETSMRKKLRDVKRRLFW